MRLGRNFRDFSCFFDPQNGTFFGALGLGSLASALAPRGLEPKGTHPALGIVPKGVCAKYEPFCSR